MFFLSLLIAATVNVTEQPCVASASAPRVDHVVIVVNDLERATTAFRNSGFRIKPGRLHANNLLNNHVKFRNGTSLELMTLAGVPGDAMAEGYARLAKEGDGGVYFALHVADLLPASRAATAIGLQTRRSSSGPWQFLSFGSSSPAAAVFFGSGDSPVHDPDSLLSHAPAANGLQEVWIEGGPQLVDLLQRLGASRCGVVRSRGQTGVQLALRGGFVVVVSPRPDSRPRVLGVVLQGAPPRNGPTRPLPTFWIDYHN
jgi:hypothetical protein